MARQWVTDELWDEVRPLLPPEKPKPKGGRPPVPDRKCLVGIIFVLRTGCGWNDLPAELGCGHGSTCWRRFQAWSEAGVWDDLWCRVLDHLGRRKRIDWSRAVADSASVRAVFGGLTRGRTPRIGPRTAANAIS
jgi:transposase